MPKLPACLADLAAAQAGAFSSSQAHVLGVDDLELHRLAGAGELLRVRRGAFVRPGALAGVRPEDAYAVRTRAVLLSRPERGWASHATALAAYGLPLVDADLERYDVCADVRREFRNGAVVTHPLPRDEPCREVKGVHAVSPETALLQTASRHGWRTAVIAADAALHDGVVSMRGLVAARDRLELGIRGAARVVRLLDAVDSKAESPGESLTRLLLTGLGLPFRCQVELRDGRGLMGRVDFLVEDHVVVEFDGLVKYEGSTGRQALAEEKRREDRLRAAGYEVVRLTWVDVRAPQRVAQLIDAARARAATRHTHSAVGLRPA
jgi:very-short-patch-repair endonuclease